MVFSSISFLYYFLPFVFILYFSVPYKVKNLILFLTSIVFYFYGEPIYVILMLVTITSGYVHALLIEKYDDDIKLRKRFLISAIIVSLSLLGFFKYTDFFIQNINNIFSSNIQLLRIALPIGISFYTFQVLSYVIDVYKRQIKAQKSFVKLATYVSMFPQLIAGPIVRYTDIEKRLESRKSTLEDFAIGIRRFILGLSKKVLIANSLGQLCDIFTKTYDKSVLFYWIYGLAYMLQIYFDFSGYSDMAIGLGRIFGFKFLENFNYPYIAISITDFWRRWHISLSTWFRDYVYIPLGGNNVNKFKWIRNFFIVWFLTGMWHGPSWNFIIWGLYFAVFLLIEKVFLDKFIKEWPRVISSIYTLFVVFIGFIIFNADGLSGVANDLLSLFGLKGLKFINSSTAYYFRSYLVILIIAIIAATPVMKNIMIKLKKKTILNIVFNLLEPVFLLMLLLIITAYLVDSSFNPFIYFRF